MRIGAVEMPLGAKLLAMAERNTFLETQHTWDARDSRSDAVHLLSSSPISRILERRCWCPCRSTS